MSTYPQNTVTYSYPGFILNGYSGNPGSGGAVVSNSSAQAAWANYKACTVYMVVFSVQGAGTAGTLKVQPYGAAGGGNGGSLGTPITVSVPASGNYISYAQPQNFTLAIGGYIQLALYASITVNVNCSIWMRQVGI